MQGFVILLALYVGVDKHQNLCYNQCQTPYIVSDAPEYPHILCIKTCTFCTILYQNITVLYQNISNFGEKYMFFVMYLYRGYLVQGISCIPPNICQTIQVCIYFGGFRSVFVILYRVNILQVIHCLMCQLIPPSLGKNIWWIVMIFRGKILEGS